MDKIVVAVLAGGRGSRLGGEKAMVELGGRPLIQRPLDAARAAGLDAIVVAKHGTVLPDVATWIEPDEPTHPLLGVVTALEHGAPIIAVACDQPWVTPELLRALADHDRPAIAVEREPFPGRYEPLQLPVLRDALQQQASLRATLGRLQPAVLGWPREEVASVNTREELAAAATRAAVGGDAAIAGGDDAATGGGHGTAPRGGHDATLRGGHDATPRGGDDAEARP